MKRILLAGLFILGWGVAQAQVAVVAPSLELQEAMNHAEQLQQMVQTYQTMVNVKDGINKGIDAVEKVNNKLATIRDVQEIATRSAACVGRIKQVYEMIGNLRLDVQYTTSLVDLCNQVTRECIDVTAYGAQDAERLAETRKVLDDLDRLNSQVSYIDVQAKAIKYNSEMLNTYF